MSTSVIVNFRGTNIIVTGETPYKDAEKNSHFVLLRSEEFGHVYDSAEHLIGRAYGKGFQTGMISNAIYFNPIFGQSDKLDFPCVRLFISPEEYERIHTIFKESTYSKQDLKADIRFYFCERYGVALTMHTVNSITDNLYDGEMPVAFQDDFYHIESKLCSHLEIDPKLFYSAAYRHGTDDENKAFWDTFYNALIKEGAKILSRK
jgi:hypothetical protein